MAYTHYVLKTKLHGKEITEIKDESGNRDCVELVVDHMKSKAAGLLKKYEDDLVNLTHATISGTINGATGTQGEFALMPFVLKLDLTVYMNEKTQRNLRTDHAD